VPDASGNARRVRELRKLMPRLATSQEILRCLEPTTLNHGPQLGHGVLALDLDGRVARDRVLSPDVKSAIAEARVAAPWLSSWPEV
jgi:hypothetical protein